MSRVHHLWLLVVIILAVCAGGFVLLYVVLFAGLPDPGAPLTHAGIPSTLLVDRHGRSLYDFIDPNGSKYIPLPLAQIPLACRQATIATEDSRFYSHPGIDLVAIARAIWQDLRGNAAVSGGSTLTQQLARTLYLSPAERSERSLRRKLREAWLAWRIERRYSKNEILNLYLNTTYYGHFAAGIEAAAQSYFGLHAAELDLAQCALLAGVPQFPAGYNPIENPEAARRRQAVVLGLMQHAGYLTAEQAAGAAAERMRYASTPFPIAAPHFVMWVQGQLEALLPPDRLASLAQTRGLKVITTLDLDWQRQAEDIVTRRLAQLRPCAAGKTAGCDPLASPARRVDDAALVALDPHTGAVLAMVGSAGYFDQGIEGAVNAALSYRQPGSAIKPLTYAAAFDPARAAHAAQPPWTPATLIADVRTVFTTAEGQPYVPQNYDLSYHGPVTARMALANSYNIPAVKALEYVGVDALIEQARRMGIDNWGPAGAAASAADPSTPPGPADPAPALAGAAATAPSSAAAAAPSAGSPARFGLSLTLGGGEVRLLDLTAAYAAFANDGHRVQPFAIERVETLDGEVLYEQPGTVTLLVVDPRVAYLVTDILSDAEARLPVFGLDSMLDIGRPAAAKTGTTTDWRDNWTVGYTPDLVTGVWVGNADNTPMQDVSGVSGAGPIWHDFMTVVLQDRPIQTFARPDGLIEVEVCADSGLLPGPPAGGTGSSVLTSQPATNGAIRVSCPDRRRELFIAGTEPQQIDAGHYGVTTDARTGGPVTSATPAGARRTDTFWLLPAELQDWARANGVPQPVFSGPGNIAAGGNTADAVLDLQAAAPLAHPLVLISPDPNRTYRLDLGLPPEAQRLPVVARPGSGLAAGDLSITLLVDGRALATVREPDFTAWWQLAPGRHVLQAVAANDPMLASPPISITVLQ